MRRFFNIFFSVALLLLVVSCSSFDVLDESSTSLSGSESSMLTITASTMGTDSKAYLEDSRIQWSRNDVILVVSEEGYSAHSLPCDADGSEYEFSISNWPLHQTPKYALYNGPLRNKQSNSPSTTYSDGRFEITLKTDQQINNVESFSNDSNISIGEVSVTAEGYFAVMKNVCALMRFKIDSEMEVKSIRIRDIRGRAMTGRISVGMTDVDGVLLPEYTVLDGTPCVTLTSGVEGAERLFPANTYYACVLPGTYMPEITVTYADDTESVLTAKSEVTIERSKWKDFGTIDKGESLRQEADLNVQLARSNEHLYNDLTDTYKSITKMPWELFNTAVYIPTQTSAATFWDYYGGDDDEYTVTLSVLGANGQSEVLATKVACADGNAFTLVSDGVQAVVRMNDYDATTCYAEVMINNKIKTQHSYMNVDNKGAKYTITIKIISDCNSSWENYVPNKGNIVMVHEFYVKDSCVKYEYNPLYCHHEYRDLDNGNIVNDAIVIKGQLNAAGKWEMSTMVREHFLNVGGEDIFGYFNKVDWHQNIKMINFHTRSGDLFWTGSRPYIMTALNKEMTQRDQIYPVTYQLTLNNGELCDPVSYNVVFVNPFVDASKSPLSMYGNAAGTVTGSLMPLVKVADNEGDMILEYNETAGTLSLTDKAVGTYKVDMPTEISFAFDKTSADYKAISSQMSSGSVLDCDSKTGTVTWLNEGSSLTRDYKLPVNVSVTFDKLSMVIGTIDVELLSKKFD